MRMCCVEKSGPAERAMVAMRRLLALGLMLLLGFSAAAQDTRPPQQAPAAQAAAPAAMVMALTLSPYCAP